MARARKYYLKNNYLTLRSKVKVPRRSLRYTTHHLMVMHPYQISLTSQKKQLFHLKVKGPTKVIMVCDTALWSCTHIPNIIDLSRKKQLFDLEVKGQVPTKFITVCDTPPYGHTPTYQISLTLSRKKQLFDLAVKGQVPTKFIMVRDTPPYCHTPTYQILLTYLK